MNRDELWRKSAACIGLAPLFDATLGDESRWQREPDRARDARHERAKAVCRGCPVQRECRDDTLLGRDEGVRFGIVLAPLDRNKRKQAS